MIKPGTLVLLNVPHGDLTTTKLRPVLIIAKAPSTYIKGVDEIIDFNDPDYRVSGVKTQSLIRVSQLLTTDQKNFVGEIGSVSKARLKQVQSNIVDWIQPKK